MAVRLLQFGAVLAIGLCLGRAPGAYAIHGDDRLPPGKFSARTGAAAGSGGVTEITPSLTLEDPPAEVIVGRGQSISIPCAAKSSPGAGNLRIRWLRDGKPISNSAPNSLEIPRITGRRLEGEYRCLASNDAGALLSKPTKLVVASISRDFVHHPENVSVNEQLPVVLPCGIQSKPDAIIHWEVDNRSLPHSTRYVPLPSGSLLITNARSSDAGSYRCFATNKILNKTRKSNYGTLTVLPTVAEERSPQFIDLGVPYNHTVPIGGSLNLYCAVSGWPIPILHWLKGDGMVIGNSSILELQQVTLDVTGNYSCVAYNSGGRMVQHHSVMVLRPPYFNVTPVSKAYPPAKTVRLECQALGVPAPNVTWLKNGEILPMHGRIKQQPNSLVLSHSFTTDAGVYQCVASNRGGVAWASAQLVPYFSENRPKPPQNVQCRPYDETSICLEWDPTANPSVIAYSVYSFYAGQGQDYVTNTTILLASGLNEGTNYTFYVRSYSKEASDQSNNVTCVTGVEGDRNLEIKKLDEGSVELKWSEISNDVPCGSKARMYKIQWKKVSQMSISREFSTGFAHVVKGLRPSTLYEFRVQSTTNRNDNSPWVTFKMSDGEEEENVAQVDPTTGSDVSKETNESRLDTPQQLEADPLTPYSVNLTWNGERDENEEFYTVCYVQVQNDEDCEKGVLLKSENNFLEVRGLKPNTLYEFQVRTESKRGSSSPFSHSIEVQTLPDLPSVVQELKYRPINSTAVCVKWRAPSNKNGKLNKYAVSYTPDKNWPLEKWYYVDVPLTQRNRLPCWSGEPDSISIVLANLQRSTHYTVLVRAENEAGMGNPTVPITFTMEEIDLQIGEEGDAEFYYKRTIGIIIGTAVSLLCVTLFCVLFIWRSRILKEQARNRARLGGGPNNYFPSTSGTPYSGTSLQLRGLQEGCTVEAHEMQHLVAEDGSTLHAANFSIADPKGGPGLPNGQINGNLKHSLVMNGHVPNGHVNITENPRYNYRECNGYGDSLRGRKLRPPLVASSDYNSNCSSDLDDSKLSGNETQLTYLDESFVGRRLSPALGPNG